MLEARTLRSAALTALTVLASAVLGDVAQAAANVTVGMTTRQYTDEKRTEWEGSQPRPLTTVVWYPVAPTRPLKFVFDSPRTPVYFPDAVAADAPLASSPGTYPLVLLSHGGGS